MFRNMDDGQGKVYSLEIESPYTGKSSMLFYNVNSAAYWTHQYQLAGNVRGTLRLLCKRHAKYNSSWKFGACCKVIEQF